jgi:hypothetical protein
MAKHVIILGAGASKSSGYPLANELRLEMSSEEHLRKILHNADPDFKTKQSLTSAFVALRGEINPPSKQPDGPVLFFREGGFASVDEFCKLGSGYGLQEHVNIMRSWTRSVLSIRNPETTFEQSDYYGFVQSLFEGNLYELRDDLAVLSFNYDVYLEYLLLRAVQVRRRVAKILDGESQRIALYNSVTGGFHNERDLEWLAASKRFCVLKLHGSIVTPEEYGCLFLEKHRPMRLNRALDLNRLADVPPIVFPWEVVKENGKVCSKEDFPVASEARHELFLRVWNRAQREVTEAEKISFVGISMHPFMEYGLNFLFAKKRGKLEVVIANNGNRKITVALRSSNIIGATNEVPDRRCPAGLVQQYLIGLKIKDLDLRPLYSTENAFRTFIAEEMV